MTKEIHVPTLGESVTEATIGSWLKEEGAFVSLDEPLVELETDKVSIEVPAPASGVLSKISAQPGESVEVGALLGVIDETAEKGAQEETKEKKPEETKEQDRESPPDKQMPPAPSAAKLMREKDLSQKDIEGTGRRGQILKEDVLRSLEALKDKSEDTPSEKPKPEKTEATKNATGERRVPLSKLRQTIARRLKDAQNTAAMLTTFNEVDLTAVKRLRAEYGAAFEKKYGIKLGFMGFFTKAVCQALLEIPAVNAEIDGNDLIYKDYCHIGVAVGTEKGLVVPVIRNADQLSLAHIEKAIIAFGKKAREGTLGISDMQGGTFTISNGGVYGSLMSTPILNMPQSGILGMHKIQDRPVAINGALEIRPMMYLALSYDHRVIDGKEAVTFLVRIKALLEDPCRFVVGV